MKQLLNDLGQGLLLLLALAAAMGSCIVSPAMILAFHYQTREKTAMQQQDPTMVV
jgi:hypothetical protein